MPSSDDALRASLMELIEVCPVEQCNPSDCPLFLLRILERRQRLHWIKSLERTDLEYLAAYHHICMNVRIEGKSRLKSRN